MELPRKILIGEGVLSQVGVLIRTLNESAADVAVVTGRRVKSKAGDELKSSLEKVSLKSSLHVVNHASMSVVDELEDKIGDKLPDFVIGFGGGRSILPK
jgi:glycerol-1-phosphate dehydrogenase [NAD(P)+]